MCNFREKIKISFKDYIQNRNIPTFVYKLYTYVCYVTMFSVKSCLEILNNDIFSINFLNIKI